MVVDKRDLAVGRTPGPADAEPGMRAVQNYREGKAPDSNDSGAGSPTSAQRGRRQRHRRGHRRRGPRRASDRRPAIG